MKVIGTIIFIAVWSLLAWIVFYPDDARSGLDITTGGKYSSEQQETIKRGINYIFKHCPSLKQHIPDFETAEAGIGEPPIYIAEAIGWKQAVWFRPAVSHTFEGAESGHTLYFTANPDHRPGIVIGKKEAAELCPAEWHGKDVFLAEDGTVSSPW